MPNATLRQIRDALGDRHALIAAALATHRQRLLELCPIDDGGDVVVIGSDLRVTRLRRSADGPDAVMTSPIARLRLAMDAWREGEQSALLIVDGREDHVRIVSSDREGTTTIALPRDGGEMLVIHRVDWRDLADEDEDLAEAETMGATA